LDRDRNKSAGVEFLRDAAVDDLFQCDLARREKLAVRGNRYGGTPDTLYEIYLFFPAEWHEKSIQL
jgi:hypothetical protein